MMMMQIKHTEMLSCKFSCRYAIAKQNVIIPYFGRGRRKLEVTVPAKSAIVQSAIDVHCAKATVRFKATLLHLYHCIDKRSSVDWSPVYFQSFHYHCRIWDSHWHIVSGYIWKILSQRSGFEREPSGFEKDTVDWKINRLASMIADPLVFFSSANTPSKKNPAGWG